MAFCARSVCGLPVARELECPASHPRRKIAERPRPRLRQCGLTCLESRACSCRCSLAVVTAFDPKRRPAPAREPMEGSGRKFPRFLRHQHRIPSAPTGPRARDPPLSASDARGKRQGARNSTRGRRPLDPAHEAKKTGFKIQSSILATRNPVPTNWSPEVTLMRIAERSISGE